MPIMDPRHDRMHPVVVRNVFYHLADDVRVTTITVEEQLGGWYASLRAARTPLTLFVFAFAIAVAYLWFAEGVRLLLQPAIFGVLLAIVAAIVDARIQTRRARYLIAAPSAADFVATATSPSAIEPALVPSSDPAAPRLARTEYQVLPPPEPVSSSDRGSGA